MPVSQYPTVISDFLCGSGQNGKGIFLPSWREAAHSGEALLPNPTVLCPALAQVWSSLLRSFHLTGFPLPFHTPHPICSAVLPPPVLPGFCSCGQQGSITWSGIPLLLSAFPPAPTSHLYPVPLPISYQDVFHMLCSGSSECPACPPPHPHLSPDSLLHSTFLLAGSHQDPTGELQLQHSLWSPQGQVQF